MALEGRTVVHANIGVNVVERMPIADRAAAAVTAPAMADRFMTHTPSTGRTPNASRGGTPAQNAARGRSPEKWSTGLFSIHKDCCGCIYASLCPCLVVGRMGSFLFAPTSKYWHCSAFLCFWFCSSYQYREKMRKKFSLPAEPCGDFCTHAGCMFCAICQEHRELTRRGVDLSWFYPKGHCGSPTCRAQHAPSEMVMHK